MFSAQLKKLPWQRFLKFLITGGSALLLDFLIYLALTRLVHLPYLGSRAISLGVAMIWNFSLNRHWTFQAKEGGVATQATRFLIVMTTTSLLSLALMRVGVSFLGFNDILVIIVVAALITLINFSAHYLWSYARR